jgi:hypothetical protein
VSTPLLIAVALGLLLHAIALFGAVRRPASHLSNGGGKALWVYLLAVGMVVPGGPLAPVYLLAVPKGK